MSGSKKGRKGKRQEIIKEDGRKEEEREKGSRASEVRKKVINERIWKEEVTKKGGRDEEGRREVRKMIKRNETEFII